MQRHTDCQTIDALVTPYVDRQLADGERQDVEAHLRVCPPCQSRVAAEQTVRDLLRGRRGALEKTCAPEALRAKCAEYARATVALAAGSRPAVPDVGAHAGFPRRPAARLGRRAAPIALAASLVLLVAGAFLYQLTASSARVLATELTADHLKCFAMNGVLNTHDTPAAVQSSMWSSFGWRMELPEGASKAGLELVGARPCLYGEGRIAHIMYRHHGEPVSLFMLPERARQQEVVRVLGHETSIWCVGNRTFVLVARETRQELDRLASLVRASLR